MRLKSKHSGSTPSLNSLRLRPSKILFDFLKKSFVDVGKLLELFQGLRQMNLIPKRGSIKLGNLKSNGDRIESNYDSEIKSNLQKT